MLLMWVGFIALVVVLLALDIGVFHRLPHVVHGKEALKWTSAWIAAAVLFTVFVYFAYENRWFGVETSPDVPDGKSAAFLFFTGYVVEKSLSVDNLFVIAMTFSALKVPPRYQHRVLFWGILGALAMRGLMILAGSALIEHFHWALYLFGAFLLATATKLAFARQEPQPENGLLVRWVTRLLPVTHQPAEARFVARVNGRRMLTPLGLSLVAVESADVMFAADSIPAIFAIVEDPFIVFTSNIFALLGLRSLYFALVDVMHRFHYARATLVVLLASIGVKMLLKDLLHAIPGITYFTLAAIALILGTGAAASILRAGWMKRQTAGPSKKEAVTRCEPGPTNACE